MNKKLVTTILVIAGVGLAIYMFNKSKKAKSKVAPAPKPEVAPAPKQPEMATEKDALEFMEALKKKGFMVRALTTEFRKAFINEYKKDITKDEHLKVIEMLKKEPTEWTLEEEFFYKDVFQNGVLTFDE